MPKKDTQRRIDVRNASLTPVISGGPTSGGVSGVTDHGLLTGLTDDDHPQYYNSTRGDARWAITAGNGLTLTAGVLDVGAGAGITVSADAVALASTVAGDGLTLTAGVLDVGAGNGLTVAADSIALTTPGTLTVSTSNSASGSHTHAITASADVGTTPAAAILKSTSGGGLTLASLNAKGSIDVTDGGDLTVAGSGSYAGNNVLFVDSSGGNVGIMGAPDPQFALDVVGPARATYFVGPHAIQLKDVLLLCHYDGRGPLETNFVGEPNGHMGQVATVSGGVTYRAGMFGTKAIQVAEARTNLIPNPSFEVDLSGWSTFESGTGAAWTRVGSASVVGSYSLRIDPSTTGNAIAYTGDILSVANGATVSASAWLYHNAGGSGAIEIYDASGPTVRATVSTTLDTEWEYLTCTWTNSTGSAKDVRFRALNTAPGTSYFVLVDACQLESGTSTPYIDGTLGTGHTWAGTAHASSSSRTAGNINYPTSGNINTVRGTVMAWVWVASVTTGVTAAVLSVAGSSAGDILLRVNGTSLQGYWGTSGVSGGSIKAGVWTHVAMTYNGSTLLLYVNGVQVGTGAESGFSGVPATMGVGRTVAGGSLLNGRIDDLVTLSSVLPADGVRAVYESAAPVFAESSRFSFRATPRGLVWADDDGLWMRDTSGGAVLGIYGGDSTKSWGGTTLAQGDLLIGSTGGTTPQYVLWDDSAGTLTIKGAITADSGNISGLLSIGASGGIVVGSGTKDSTLDGWHIGNTEIVGQLDGVDQVVLTADGDLRAGGVIIDDDGLFLPLGTTGSNTVLRIGQSKSGHVSDFIRTFSDWGLESVSWRTRDSSDDSAYTSIKQSTWEATDGGSLIEIMADEISFVGPVKAPVTITSTAPTLYIGDDTVGLGDVTLKLGNGRTQVGYAYIDLVGDTTYTAYGIRILRGNSGPNADSYIYHRGTGNFVLRATEEAPVLIQTNGTTRVNVQSTGEAKFENGVFVNGDPGGISSYVGLTDVTVGVSSGTGTVKMNGTSAANSTGWLKIYVGTAAKYIPYWDSAS